MAAAAFVGREVELSRLDDLVRAAKTRRGAIAQVTGEASIGKSTLVREAIRRAPGSTMVFGRAVPGSLVAGRALCDAAVAAVAAGADPTHPNLRLLSRPLARLLGVDLPWTTSEAAADQTAFDPHPLGLADCLLRLVALIPGLAVLVLEDLHWADPETLEALPALSDRAEARGVLVIMTARTAESPRVDEVLDRLAREPTTHTVALGPLDASSARQLTTILIGPSGTPELVSRLVEQAEGVPLAIEQLCKAPLHGGTALPPTIAASVATRLHQLSPEHRRLIVAAALGGQRTAPDLLATALGLSSDDVAAAVAAGARIGLCNRSALTVSRSVTASSETRSERRLAARNGTS